MCESVPACALAHMRVSLSVCVSAADSDRVRGVSSYLLTSSFVLNVLGCQMTY